jgi:glutamate 5-kinase
VSAGRIVIKIGSNVIARADGTVNVPWLEHLCAQVAALHRQGWEPLIVSSGAVASGRSLLPLPKKTDPVTQRQLLAAIGQTQLINTYTQLLEPHQLICAQVLVTKEDFRSRRHYLNVRHCLDTILHHRAIPIVNENDVVSVTELMFTDNDELAGLVAAMIDAERLVILTNVAGIYDRPPTDPAAQLIDRATVDTDFAGMISAERSDFGRGGMLTKVRMAQKVAALGVGVHIADGRQPEVLVALLQASPPGTFIEPLKKSTGLKRWISHSGGYVQGSLTVNAGALSALTQAQRATSLLPVGITHVGGTFEKNDIVRLHTPEGETFGIGRVRYASTEVAQLLGQRGHKPVVHYDYLYLY